MTNFLTEKNVNGISLNSSVRQIEISDEKKFREILNDMTKAFYQQRKGCETQRKTEEYCRSVLKTCLTGFHADGRVWKNSPGKNTKDDLEALQQRLRVFKYDLTTKMLIKGREKTVSERIKNSGTAADAMQHTLHGAIEGIPDRAFSFSESVDIENFKAQFIADFPSSITAVDEMMIERLAFLMILNKRDIQFVDLSKDLTKEIKDLAESLGVAGKQRAAAMNSDKAGTIDQLTMKYKVTLDEHVEIETEWKLEELKLISNAVHRGTTPEFLAMSWVKELYGKTIEGEELSLKALDKFLKRNGIDV